MTPRQTKFADAQKAAWARNMAELAYLSARITDVQDQDTAIDFYHAVKDFHAA